MGFGRICSLINSPTLTIRSDPQMFVIPLPTTPILHRSARVAASHPVTADLDREDPIRGADLIPVVPRETAAEGEEATAGKPGFN